MGRQGFGAYLKAAFKNQWNYLALGAGVVLAFLSGRPDIVLPIVAAAELGVLVSVASHPRYQNLCDGLVAAKQARVAAETMAQRYDRIYTSLPEDSQRAFDALRGRLENLRELLGAPSGAAAFATADEEQLAGVNRLLWVYLKLLYTRSTLENFFSTTDGKELDRQAAAAKARLDALPADSVDPIAQKKRTSLLDTVATLEARRDNVARARDNYEFIQLELGRIAAKLSGLAELAINRQDPTSLSAEVDDVARSVSTTEQTMSELGSLTGLGADTDDAGGEVPSIVRARAAAQQAEKNR